MFETLVRSNGGLLYSLFESIGEFTVHEVHYRSSASVLFTVRKLHMVLFLSTPSAKWNGKDSKPISISTDGDGKRQHALRSRVWILYTSNFLS